MVNSVNVLGLRVESISPLKSKTGVDLNSDIKLEFNSDLDTSSIISNIFILEDNRSLYNALNEIDVDDYKKVDGTLTYKNKIVTFTPKSQLNIDTKYIIYIPKNNIVDILGNIMLTDFISTFSTEPHQTFKRCNIIYPVNNTILKSLDKIEVENLGSERYLIQISKIKTFDNVVLEEIIDSNIIERDFNLGDGLYFLRAKTIDGKFGDDTVLTIKTHKNTVPTDQDIDDNYIWEEYGEEGLILETYPLNDTENISEKTNVIYMKVDGIVDINDIDFYESFIDGTYNDDDDSTSKKSHNEVDGSYTIVQDNEKLETYIFFTPVSL